MCGKMGENERRGEAKRCLTLQIYDFIKINCIEYIVTMKLSFEEKVFLYNLNQRDYAEMKVLVKTF